MGEGIMLDLLGTVLTGGVTGIIGSIIGNLFGFIDLWFQEKKAASDHLRTLEMLKLQNSIREEESERELALADANAELQLRTASYAHDTNTGLSSVWVVNILRLVRPFLTMTLILMVGVLYFKADAGGRATIEASVIYMASSAVLWWFGDRALRKK